MLLAMLLAAGADPNVVCKRGGSVLSWAIESASLECCKAVLQAVAVINPGGRFALMPGPSSVAMSEDPVELHLRPGLDLEIKDKLGCTPLMYAAMLEYHDIYDLLLDHGANIDAFDAVYFNDHVTLKFLLDRGASRTVLDRDGDSILYQTATRADIRTMSISQKACIDGLFMDPSAIAQCWKWFECRDIHFAAQRAPLEEETTAFQALLDSIIPCPDPPPPPPPPPSNEHDRFNLAVTFPLDSDG